MRIAFIGSKGIPAATARGGGVETHVEELAVRLAERGHRVTVYCRSYANPQRRKTYKGVHLVTLPTIDRKNWDAIISTFFATIHALFNPYDIVSFQGVGPSTLAWILRIFKPWSRVVVTFHSRDRFHGKWGIIARMYLALGEWTAVRFPHATIAVSHVIQIFCWKMYGAKADYIPNGSILPKLPVRADALAKFNLKPNDYFFTFSRLVPHKAIEDAIHAYKGLETDKKLVILGRATYDDLEYEARLHALATDDPRVIFLGHQLGEELRQIIGNSYAMIHPSRSEGLSVAIIEAMSYGKLVIMSDIPENLELIDHSGVAYRVGDVEALRATLQWFARDPELVAERGHRAREIVARRYSWDSVVDRTEWLFHRLLRDV